jgi:DNA mismatch endonuclease (patch repair protein)
MAASRSAPRVTVPPPRFAGLAPASARASHTASAASRKRDTNCEQQLRRALWRLGLRYRVDVAALPGRPDIVFGPARVAVFCDGDFWHGRDLDARLRRLARGHNAPYWVAKIKSNVARDRQHDETLARDGWLVLRFWETDIRRDASALAAEIAQAVSRRRP